MKSNLQNRQELNIFSESIASVPLFPENNPMRNQFRSVLLTSFLFIFLSISLPAQATLVDFEGLSDNLSLSNEIPGLTFNGATVLTAGLSLNEFDFPPTSGENVAAALTSLLEVTFTDLMDTVSGYFTYAEPLTFSIYDTNGGLLASIQSAVASNLGSNELITLSGQGIALLRINSNSNFTLDDLSYSKASVPAPEPATILLLAIGAMGFGVSRFTQKRCNFR